MKCVTQLIVAGLKNFPIVHDKFRNRKQFETNRNDENAMSDYPNIYEYVSDYIRFTKTISEHFMGTFANKAR